MPLPEEPVFRPTTHPIFGSRTNFANFSRSIFFQFFSISSLFFRWNINLVAPHKNTTHLLSFIIEYVFGIGQWFAFVRYRVSEFVSESDKKPTACNFINIPSMFDSCLLAGRSRYTRIPHSSLHITRRHNWKQIKLSKRMGWLTSVRERGSEIRTQRTNFERSPPLPSDILGCVARTKKVMRIQARAQKPDKENTCNSFLILHIAQYTWTFLPTIDPRKKRSQNFYREKNKATNSNKCKPALIEKLFSPIERNSFSIVCSNVPSMHYMNGEESMIDKTRTHAKRRNECSQKTPVHLGQQITRPRYQSASTRGPTKEQRNGCGKPPKSFGLSISTRDFARSPFVLISFSYRLKSSLFILLFIHSFSLMSVFSNSFMYISFYYFITTFYVCVVVNT